MARNARVLSKSGIYHVVMQGVDHHRIFEDEEDDCRFLEILAQCREQSRFDILAYCLMDDHIHLLIKTYEEPLGALMKRVTVRFVLWYNKKHDRVGRLFHDRFKSEPVDSEDYLLTVFRHILQNPVEAGLVDDPWAYPWSSAKEYLEDAGISDTGLVLSLIPPGELKRFLQQEADGICLDIPAAPPRRMTDEEARSVIAGICGSALVSDFLALPPEEQHRAVVELAGCGASLRQMSRLTGLSLGVIRGHLRRG